MVEKNPIIGSNIEDTLLNIHSVLAFIQDFHNCKEFSDNACEQANNGGLSLIIKCTNQALNYEINRMTQNPKMEGGVAIFEA